MKKSLGLQKLDTTTSFYQVIIISKQNICFGRIIDLHNIMKVLVTVVTLYLASAKPTRSLPMSNSV